MVNFKVIISRLEHLSVDTQPVRDLLGALTSGIVLEEEFQSFFDNLEKELSKGHKPNSCPTSLNLMVQQLDRRLKNSKSSNINSDTMSPEDVKQLINDTIQNSGKEESKQIVSLLRDLIGEVQVLKDKSVLGTSSSSFNPTQVGSNIIPEEKTFVDLTDNKASDIKSYVNISTEQGVNLNSALEKLKKLKQG